VDKQKTLTGNGSASMNLHQDKLLHNTYRIKQNIPIKH